MSTHNRVKPFVLMVLDGWGYREDRADNAIAQAKKPHWDALWQQYTHTLISGSGEDVGLPDQQMGNSEVGHMNLGAGRIVYQELTRIDQQIRTGEFGQNPVLKGAVTEAARANKAVHIFGLLSNGGVHSHENHLLAMVKMAAQQGAKQVYVHAFLDGRDTPPQSAEAALQRMDALLAELKVGRVASIVGRYYAMDRDKRWDRVEQAYTLLTAATAPYQAASAVQGLAAAYQRGETDEFVKPTLISDSAHPAVKIGAGDTVIFMNFRSDRARELTHAFVDETFTGFARGAKLKLQTFVTLTQYEDGLPVQVAYPPASLADSLGECFAKAGLQQLRIAETEKYAHVTFFFNGGVEVPFVGEERVLVPSPKVATYDLQPEMSAPELTDRLVEAIESGRYDLIVCNYANADMVGHTGQMPAAIKAIETLDTCLGRVVAALHKVGGEALITADHGNAEVMADHGTGQPHTAHTNLVVPLVYVGRRADVKVQDGRLSDVAPTLLSLVGLPIPKAMTGRVVFQVKN